MDLLYASREDLLYASREYCMQVEKNGPIVCK